MLGVLRCDWSEVAKITGMTMSALLSPGRLNLSRMGGGGGLAAQEGVDDGV